MWKDAEDMFLNEKEKKKNNISSRESHIKITSPINSVHFFPGVIIHWEMKSDQRRLPGGSDMR